MRILVTGGAGYVGSNITSHLLNLNHDITVIDDESSDVYLHRPFVHRLRDYFDTPVSALQCHPEKYDVIVHAAAWADVRFNWVGSEFPFRRVFSENVNTTEDLLKFARGTPVIFLSTAAVYGSHHIKPFDEYDACYPQSPYAASKVACEAIQSAYAAKYGVKHTTLRLPSVVGGVGYHHGCIVDFVRQGKIGPIRGLSNGHERRPHVHVADVAKAVAKLIEAPSLRGSTYNLLGGYLSCRDIVSIMSERHKVEATWADCESAWPGDHEIRIDGGAFQRRGFSYSHSVSDGVKQTLEGLGW